MPTLASRRHGKKGILAAALVTAGLASSGLASPALAVPVNIDSPGHTFQFGTGCVAGAAAQDADLDWRPNAAGTTISPRLVGALCLQSTMATARVVVQHHGPGHGPLITQVGSLPSIGNGGALSSFNVALNSPRITVASGSHVHVQLQEFVGGAWTDIFGVREILNYP